MKLKLSDLTILILLFLTLFQITITQSKSQLKINGLKKYYSRKSDVLEHLIKVLVEESN
jgi:hypothetical protein